MTRWPSRVFVSCPAIASANDAPELQNATYDQGVGTESRRRDTPSTVPPARDDSLLEALRASMEIILFTCRKQDFLLEEINQFFDLIENVIEDNVQGWKYCVAGCCFCHSVILVGIVLIFSLLTSLGRITKLH